MASALAYSVVSEANVALVSRTHAFRNRVVQAALYMIADAGNSGHLGPAMSQYLNTHAFAMAVLDAAIARVEGQEAQGEAFVSQ